MEAVLILADAAQSEGGKVHMLGAGWSLTGTPTAPQAVVGLLKVPWDRANTALPLRLVLTDEDGHDVLLPGPDGVVDQRIEFQAMLEVGRPEAVKPGTPIDSSLAVNVQPMPLPPGRYTWRLTVDDEAFTTSFQVSTPVA